MDTRRIRFVPLLHRHLTTGHGPIPPPPPPKIPRPITLAARPILFISTFLVLHQSFASFSYLPVYGYFRLTDSSTSFLVGPYTTFLLRQPLPFSRGERTVEDLVDTVLRSSVKTGWRFWSKWKGWKVNENEGSEIAEEVLDGLEGKKRWRDRVVERAAAWKAEHGDQAQPTTVTLNLNLDKLRAWKDRQLERADSMSDINVTQIVERKDGTLKKITDAAAAYLVVKAIFPFRLAASVFLTPRLARVLVRRWG